MTIQLFPNEILRIFLTLLCILILALVFFNDNKITIIIRIILVSIVFLFLTFMCWVLIIYEFNNGNLEYIVYILIIVSCTIMISLYITSLIKQYILLQTKKENLKIE